VPAPSGTATVRIVPAVRTDLVGLSADVFDPKALPDEALRRVRAVMTVLGGRVVRKQ